MSSSTNVHRLAHLGVVHEPRAEALDLLVGRHGAEGDLPEPLAVERAVRHACSQPGTVWVLVWELVALTWRCLTRLAVSWMTVLTLVTRAWQLGGRALQYENLSFGPDNFNACLQLLQLAGLLPFSSELSHNACMQWPFMLHEGAGASSPS